MGLGKTYTVRFDSDTENWIESVSAQMKKSPTECIRMFIDNEKKQEDIRENQTDLIIRKLEELKYMLSLDYLLNKQTFMNTEMIEETVVKRDEKYKERRSEVLKKAVGSIMKRMYTGADIWNTQIEAEVRAELDNVEEENVEKN